MSIPDFQSIMRPLLELHGDEQPHLNKDLLNALAKLFKLTDDERKIMLPSGRSKMFDNRVGWAKSYLSNAGLIESPKRSVSVITARGKKLLHEHTGHINLNFLLANFPNLKLFREKKTESSEILTIPSSSTEISATPEEELGNAYLKLRENLEQEILAKIISNPPEFLERVIVDLVVKMGYGGSLKDAGEAIGRSGDEGIDGIIKEDPLGLDIIYLQAKRFDGTTIGRPEIQKFAGALQGQRAKKGIFVTTSAYSKEAKEYVTKIDAKIILIDGIALAKLMFEHGIGVAVNTTYEVKRIDTDYFEAD